MRNFLPFPAEVEVFDTYFPPSLLAVILGTIAMVLTTKLLNRYRLFRYVYFPNLVMLAMMVIYTVFIGTFLIPA